MKTVNTAAEITNAHFRHINQRRKYLILAIQIKNQLIDFVKFIYLVLVLVLLVVAVIELKHIYNVDLFPGVDTPFDKIYYAGKDHFTNGVLKMFSNIFKI